MCSTNSASPTTPSSSTPPTTARTATRWPDAGTTPFRSEKNTNWEGAYRVPEMIRWPGKIKAGSVSNDIIQHHDWLPTLLAAAGDPDVSDKLKKGYKIGPTERPSTRSTSTGSTCCRT